MKGRRKIPDDAPAFIERYAAADMRRLAPTEAEAELARILRTLGGGALAGEFRREWPVGDWTLDFYFPTVRLAIEVDGGYHRAQWRWRLDLAKNRDLEARGITVLRLANAEVFGDREKLVTRLRSAWRVAMENVRRDPKPCASRPRKPTGAPRFPPPTSSRSCRPARASSANRWRCRRARRSSARH